MRVLCALFALVACNGDKTYLPPHTGDSGGPPTDTVVEPGEEASVVVLSWLPHFGAEDPVTRALGLFVDSRLGWVNLAQCIGSSESFCASQLPGNPGDSVVVSRLDPDLKEDLDSREVGDDITLGPWSADVQRDSASNLTFYLGVTPDAAMPSGPLGLSFAGRDQWPGYSGTDDITAPTPMRITSPNPLRLQEFFDSTPIPLTWEPGTTGDVYLFVDSPAEGRLYRLDDSGSYNLDLSALPLQDGDAIDLFLGRWSRAILDDQGNTIDVLVQSNQWVHGTWRTDGSRTEFGDGYDECVDAQLAPSAVPGNYFGDLIGAGADLDPGKGSCLPFGADGIDQVVPIDLLPEDLLTVNFQLVADDAAVYLLTDCDSVETCLVGADEQRSGDVEQISWFNDTGTALRVYAVLDAFGAVTGPYNLDIIIDSLGGDILVPTCVEAIKQGPAGSGSYYGSIAGFSDLLQPKCAGAPVGAEGMTQVLLQPGQQLSATVSTPAGNPVLYLLTNCAIGDSCFLANDTQAGTTESIVYENATAASQYLYLVLDGAVDLDEYSLDLTIQ